MTARPTLLPEESFFVILLPVGKHRPYVNGGYKATIVYAILASVGGGMAAGAAFAHPRAADLGSVRFFAPYVT